jgi:hypothetical protein
MSIIDLNGNYNINPETMEVIGPDTTPTTTTDTTNYQIDPVTMEANTGEVNIQDILDTNVDRLMQYDDNYVRLKSICGIILIVVLILVILDMISDKSQIIVNSIR